MQIKLKKKLREYQKEALEYALGFDSAVCVIPTGMGKTLIGIAWVVELLNKGFIRRALILEPSRFLVEQTRKRYIEDTTLSEEDVNLVYGVFQREEREKREIWRKGIVVVCTPHTAINDIHLLENFDAVVIDECHHTTGKHAYSQLLSRYNFKFKLGLTATLAEKVRNDVKRLVSSNIRSWSYKEMKEKYPEYIPDWIGEIYDAELEEDEIGYLKKIETEISHSFARSMALRMFTKDGALALKETIENPKTMIYRFFPSRLKLELLKLRKLHKMEVVENILKEHDFDKAIIFVDRVCVAEKIYERFKNLNPVLILGRLRVGLKGQKEALKKAETKECKLLICTSVGEEGIDVPAADLLIIWSNVASPLRFIQRLGRIMRPSEKLKVAVFIATPGTEELISPDYDSLLEGLTMAKENGIDIEGIDEEIIKIVKTKSFRKYVRGLLDSEPLKFEDIHSLLKQPRSKINQWLRSLVKEEDPSFRLFYFYELDPEWVKIISSEKEKDIFTLLSSGKVEERYYASVENAEIVEEEFPNLFLKSPPYPVVDFEIYEKQGRKERIIVYCSISEDGYMDVLPKGKLERIHIDKGGIDKLFQSVEKEFCRPLYIRAFLKVYPGIPTPIHYNGIFTKKTLELTFRNALYFIKTRNELLR